MQLKISILSRLLNLLKPKTFGLDRVYYFIWYNYPFGNKPMGSEKDYLELAEKTKNQRCSSISDPSIAYIGHHYYPGKSKCTLRKHHSENRSKLYLKVPQYIAKTLLYDF